MIDLKDIVKEYQEILGENFKVKLEADIEPQSDKVQCVLTLGRKPFMVTGIDSESFDVLIQCYVPTNTEMQQYNLMHELSLLTLPVQGEIVSGGKTYNYNSFLTIRQSGAPQVDTGQFMQLKTLTGALFVTSQSDGAALSNSVEYEFYDLEPIEANEDTITGGKLITTQMTADYSALEKAPRKMNQNRATTFLSNKAHYVTLNFYVQPNEISEKLIKFLKGDEIDENAIWWLKENWTAFDGLSFTNKVKIKAGSKITAIGGGFIEIMLMLHILP